MADGLEDRYRIYRLRDGKEEPVPDPCFVLRPERDGAAQDALEAYAESVEDENPALAADLRRWLTDISFRSASEAFSGPRDDGNRGFREGARSSR